jgi:RHS repeat-associated protein
MKIIFHNGNISYLYTATGQKIKKVVSSRETITTDYLGSFQYFNNNLKHIPHAEGYVNVVNGKFKHVFNFTDHLGNIRLSYSDANRDNLITHDEILEENNFYPFGLKHTAYNTNERQYINNDQINELILILFPRFTGDGRYNYKYNGKELQEELGLNMYDYGARNYDPALGRWMNIDPLAETSRRWNPYNYCYNNPLVFVDPDGMKADWFDEKAEKTAQATEKKIEKKIYELNKGNASDKNDRIAELNKSRADIADMRNDKNNEYKFDNASNNNNNPETKRTGINEVTIYTDDDAKQIHENRHGGQIARGEYDIDSSGNVTKGIFGASKEIDAYKAQFSFEGKIEYIPYIDFNNQPNVLNFTLKGVNSFKQTISSMGQINNAFLQKLVDNPGINQTPIYPDPATNPTYYQQ